LRRQWTYLGSAGDDGFDRFDRTALFELVVLERDRLTATEHDRVAGYQTDAAAPACLDVSDKAVARLAARRREFDAKFL